MRPFLALGTAFVVFLAAGTQASVCNPGAALHTTSKFGTIPSTAVPASVYHDVSKVPEIGAFLSTMTSESTDEQPQTTGRLPSGPICDKCGFPDGTISALIPSAHQEKTTIQTRLSNPSTILTSKYVLPTILDEHVVPYVSTTVISGISTAQDGTTISEPVTPSCAKRPTLVCGGTGFFKDSQANLIKLFPQYDLVQCKAECENMENCLAVGFTTGRQCELYDANVSDMKFEIRDGWYYSVYDICCFKLEV